MQMHDRCILERPNSSWATGMMTPRRIQRVGIRERAGAVTRDVLLANIALSKPHERWSICIHAQK